MRFLLFAVLYLLPFAALAQKAPPPQPLRKIAGCTWKTDRWNDGDSFHVLTGRPQREMVVRLYFVDTPEAETAYRERIDEQAAYFGISRAQTIQLAREASAYTRKRLAMPFTVWTRERSALGRSALGRIYGIVITDKDKDLNRLLVANGLARIYGVKTTLHDGRDSKTYLAALKALEQQAKKARVGGWRFRRGS